MSSCGGAKFSGESGKVSGAATDGPIDQTADQPADVAGGLGLTCIPSQNPVSNEKVDFGCRIAHRDGRKFQESASLKLELELMIASQPVGYMTTYRDRT